MSEIDYVITKDGIFSRADVKEYVRPISSKEELTDLIERMPYKSWRTADVRRFLCLLIVKHNVFTGFYAGTVLRPRDIMEPPLPRLCYSVRINISVFR